MASPRRESASALFRPKNSYLTNFKKYDIILKKTFFKERFAQINRAYFKTPHLLYHKINKKSKIIFLSKLTDPKKISPIYYIIKN
jgi:hypothetical protein